MARPCCGRSVAQLCQRNACGFLAAPCEITTLTRAGPRWFIASSRAPRMFFGSSIAQGTVIVGQGLVVVDLRPDHRRVLGRLLGDNLALRRVLRIEPLAVAERLLCWL